MAVFDFIRNRLLGNIVGFGAGAAARDVFTPPMRDLAAELEAVFQSRRLSPADLAELVIRGARSEGAAATEAAESGFNERRFHELTLLVGNPPGPEDLRFMLNRGIIGDAEFEKGIRQGRFRTEWLDEFKALRDALLTPAESASAVARGLEAEGAGRAEARAAGLTAERFALLERLAAHPPATGELLDLLNRGRLNEAAARRALRDGGVRAEYVDDLLELRHRLPPATDLIRFGVREVFTPRIATLFRLNEDFPDPIVSWGGRIGLTPEVLRLYWAAHWDLPSAGQGFEMFHRGIVDRDTLRLLLRALDVMPYWRDRLIELAYRVPGRIDLRRMFRFGTIDRPRLLRGYLNLGYSPEDAELLARFAVREKLEHERELSKAEIVELYGERTLAPDAARDLLEQLGYDEQEAGWILGLADARRARRERDAVARVVRARYLDRELEDADVQARLSGAGFRDDEVRAKLELWQLERAENPRHITEPQMRAAWRAGIVAETRYRQHLAQLGLPGEEAEILVRLYRPA